MSKPKNYYLFVCLAYLALGVGTFVFLTESKMPATVFLRYCLYFVAILFLYLVIYVLVFSFRSRWLYNRLFNHLEIEPALGWINKQLKNKRLGEKHRIVWLMDRALVLNLKGDIDDSLLIMNNIKEYIDNKSNIFFKTLYYNNLLTFLLDSEKFDEAKELYQEHKDFFENEKMFNKKPHLRSVVENTIASYNVIFGNTENSKKQLLEILSKNNNKKVTILNTEYYIALADLKLGHKEEAKARLSKILEQSRGIHLYNMVQKKLKEI